MRRFSLAKRSKHIALSLEPRQTRSSAQTDKRALIKVKSFASACDHEDAGASASAAVGTLPKRRKLKASIDAIAGTDCVLHCYSDAVQGLLIKRYKRFLADVKVGGEMITVHCPNTGPMTGLLDRVDAPVLLSVSQNAKRKYAHTLEAIQPEDGGAWVGVHSAQANAMVARLLEQRLVPQLGAYTSMRREVKYGTDNKSRVDFVLDGPGSDSTYVEVKSVTLAADLPSGGRIALFPDTVSKRAQRHARELMQMVADGHRAAAVFLVQRGDCSRFAPCHEKDPVYGSLILQAAKAGVQMIALHCGVDPETGGVQYLGDLPVDLEYNSLWP